MNFLWNRGGLSLKASSHCRSSSTRSAEHTTDPLSSCERRLLEDTHESWGHRALFVDTSVGWIPCRKLVPGLRLLQSDGGPGGAGEASDSGRCRAWSPRHPSDTLVRRAQHGEVIQGCRLDLLSHQCNCDWVCLSVCVYCSSHLPVYQTPLFDQHIKPDSLAFQIWS